MAEIDGPNFDTGVSYEDKELRWKREKTGYFSASQLHRLMSKSDIWTEANIDYLYEVQYARTHGICLSAPDNRNFRLGRENEAFAVEWLRKNRSNLGRILHCDVDFDDKPFIRTDFGYGYSPDVRLFEIRDTVIEIKSVVGNKERSRMFSPTLPKDKKRVMVWGEHGSQILGQFIGEDNLKMVILLKYDAIDEDNLTDERDATHPARGICFNFSREEMGTRIDRGRERIVFADEFLKSGEDIDRINEFWKKRKK